MAIDQNLLKEYTNAYVMYEIASHGVDPRETLDGTIMRREHDEGYKITVYEENHKKLIKGGPYSNIIIDALPGYNLVSFYQKNRIVNSLEKTGTKEFEEGLQLLYEDDEDELAFDIIVDAIGGVFDVLGFVFFLKDNDNYLPIRSSLFDERFQLLGIDSALAGNCSWDKYQQFIGWIKEIQEYLVANVNKDITLLDAHSFLWVLPGIVDYLDGKAQIVVHKKFGKGVVLEVDDENLTVKFADGVKKLQKSIVLNNDILTFEQPDHDIEGSSQTKDEKKETPKTLNDLLIEAGIDINKTKLIRHAKSDANFKKCYDAGYVFEYTCVQDKANFDGSDTWVVFISGEGTSAVLYGCYKVNGSQPNTPDIMPEGFPVPEMFDGEVSAFELEKMDALSEYEGKLQIEWGKATQAWDQWAKNDKEILSFEYEQPSEKEPASKKSGDKQLSKKAVEVAWALLELINNNTKSITYGDLSEMTKSKPSPYYEMRMILDAINKRCDKLGLPYISAMVVNKGTGLPGEGFRELCINEFGYDESLTTQEIVDLELDKIEKCDRWSDLADYLLVLKPETDEKKEKTGNRMTVYYVYQGQTYKEEHDGGYVWSPQRNKAKGKNAGYEMMRNIRKGDFILHNSNGKIMSISVAQSDCFEADQPLELQKASTTVDWNDEGYRIDTKYYDFDVPLITTNHTEWLADHYIDGSAFTNQGKGKQQYMCGLAEEHAIYLIEKAIELQTSNEVLNNLKAALEEIIGDKNSEYDQAEMESIEQLVDDSDDEEKPEWSGEKQEQAMTTSSATGRAIPKRDPQRAADALLHADYLCEYDNSDRTFLRKNGKPYTEPHHLIPISKYRDFDYSVDVMENIVSLCSHCHNLLHYGRFEDKKPILEKLYNDRKDALKECGLDLTLEDLEGYYK